LNPPHAQAVVLAFYANRPGATPSDKALVEMGFDTLDHYYKKRDALARRGLLHIERRSVVPGEGGGRPRVSAFLTPTGERFLEECLANPHPLFDTARNAAKRELPVRSLRIASLKDRSEFLDLYKEEYERRVKAPYVLSRADHGAVSRFVIAEYPREYWLPMVRRFLSNNGKVDGRGKPRIHWFVHCAPVLAAAVAEDLRDKAREKAERAARSPEEKQEERDGARVNRIVDSLFDSTLVDRDRAWLYQHTKDWPPARRFAKHNQSIMRAALTDRQFARHEKARESWLRNNTRAAKA